jgi:hypothetical protein
LAEPAEFDAQRAYGYRKQCWGGLGYFSWPPPLLDYMAKEHCFRGGTILLEPDGYAFAEARGLVERCQNAPSAVPGGMLLPLAPAAARWLTQTQGRGYLGLTLD